jgi:hypothetical protein
MKLLQKMLIVMMIGIFAGNMDGMITRPAVIHPKAAPKPKAAAHAVPAPAPPPAPAILPLLAAPGVGAPSLDFNNIIAIGDVVQTFSQPKISNTQINGAPNTRCIYFTLIPAARDGFVANTNFRNAFVRHIFVGDVNIYFPENGSQPTTVDAARYSCANIVSDHVTDWYVRAFGGNTGVELSYGRVVPGADHSPQMGFAAGGGAAHIITVNMTPLVGGGGHPMPANFAQQFWQTFRTIASNPVGRVLLYRILIEIRRQNAGIGTCGDGIVPGFHVLTARNLCRSIEIRYNLNRGNSFAIGAERTLRFDNSVMALRSITLRIAAAELDTNLDPDNKTVDIPVFHEMLHWLHFLRHPQRYIDSDDRRPRLYRYLLRSYYGDYHSISELYTWGAAPDDEEIRVILGTPNYNIPAQLVLMDYQGTFLGDAGGGINIAVPAPMGVGARYIPETDRFLEGDDLSENVYRMARERNVAAMGPAIMAKHKMRFGHGDVINPIDINMAIPNRFRLAHLVATDCYRAITGGAIINWALAVGQAAQP